MEPTVREARPEDWPAVTALLAELGRPAAGPDDTGHRETFLGYLSRDDAVALVAEIEGRVVGFLDLEFRRRLNYRTPQAWIPDLVVTEMRRSRGVGRALLARAEQLARERECWSITLESALWRERAHTFYEREGWSAYGKSFGKSYTGDRRPPPPQR